MQRIAIHLIILIAFLASCSQSGKRHNVGISQCSEDIWREKQNSELRMGAYFHDNVELRFAAAYDSDKRQVQQIDSLLATGIDLLIVAPNQVATISPAIDRAFDKGIPVIVFERKTNSQKYTAYMGADNYEMGRVMGEYIATQLEGHGRVVEVMGLKGSSPAIERHKGFTDAITQHPGIEVVATLQGDWTEESAYEAVLRHKGTLSGIDYVFGQNDRMAVGARRALKTSHTKFCGIDGLPGKNGGIQMVRDSILDATYIYPTRGDQLLQLAMDILDGKPYEKETALMSALVTRDNARVLQMSEDETQRQSAYLDQLHRRADTYLQQLGTQRTVTLLAILLIILLLALAIFAYRYHLQKLRLQEERTRMEHEQLDFYTQAAHQLRTPLTLIEGPLSRLCATSDIKQAGKEARQMFDIVQRNTAQLSELVNKILDVQAKGSIAGAIDDSAIGTSACPSTRQETEEGLRQAQAPTGRDGVYSLLIVDDNADIRAYLRSILADHYQVHEAADGQQGLDTARAEVPDLIISDVMMPIMNGLDFCQRVKDDFVTSHIPVILLTARALNQHQVEGYRSGADAYITKPFQPNLLLARIDNLLRSRQQLKDLWGNRDSTGKTGTPLGNQQQQPAVTENPFIARFKEIIESRMGDSGLSVEDIGQEMALSRVQLYRKVKALTGSTPIDLLRKARLAKAHILLTSTNDTISEIAYAVGFSAPSYFSKCFKEEFGMAPGDVRL